MTQSRITRRTSNSWLWLIAVSSLALNLLTLIALVTVRGLLADSITETNRRLYATLQLLENYEYQLPLHVSEQVTLSDSDAVMYKDTLQFDVGSMLMISESLPFSDTIRIQFSENVAINETVAAPLNIQGVTVLVNVPVRVNVPINIDVDIPFNTSVPVRMEVPIAFQVDAQVEESIPLRNAAGEPLRAGIDFSTQVPLRLDEMFEQTQFEPMLQELHKTLNILESVLLLPPPAR